MITTPARLTAAALLAGFCGMGAWSAWVHAPTYDEPVLIAGGHLIVSRGEYRFAFGHPPLAKVLAAAPLLPLALDPPAVDVARWPADLRQQFVIADRFLYRNRVGSDAMLFLARLPGLALGALAGLLVFVWATMWGGRAAGGLAVALYATCSLLIDQASVATTDLPVTAAMLLSLFAARRFADGWRGGWGILMGGATASAIMAKHTGLLLLPMVAVLLGLSLRRQGLPRAEWSRVLRGMAGACLGGLIVVVGVYQGEPEWYGRALRRAGALLAGQATFLLGEHSTSGWRGYYLVALAAKLPPPLLLLGLWGTVRSLRRGDATGAPTPAGLPDIWWMVVPCLALLGLASMSRQQLGVRYVLPLVPLLCMAAGQVFAGGVAPATRRVVAGLVAWQALGAVLVAPHFHAYFSELAGGPSRGYRVLVDSNLDWGQDLKPLGLWLQADRVRRGPASLILSYFGTADPAAYGIDHFQELATVGPLRRSRWINPGRPARELLAISATNLQSVYYATEDPDRFGWLRDREPPLAVVGHSIFVYDITGRRDIHARLAGIYRAGGWRPEAARELLEASPP